MTLEDFYRGLPEALGAGEPQDFQPEVEFRKLAWWDSLVYLRLLDYLETVSGEVFPNKELEAIQSWQQLEERLKKMNR